MRRINFMILYFSTVVFGLQHSFTKKEQHIYKKRTTLLRELFFLCRHYLSSRAVTSQVLWAQMSLTAVFGMGTGGPSSQSAPTSSIQAPYRSLPPAAKAHSLRCISSSSQTHFIGLCSESIFNWLTPAKSILNCSALVSLCQEKLW